MGKVTSLQAPHRIVDAILRDSVVEEEVEEKGEKKKVSRPFRGQKDESSFGQRLRRVSAQNATALFELCPTALLLGMWDSTGPKGGLGAKFERAMVSEIVGINATFGIRTSSRIDPIIRKNPPVVRDRIRRMDSVRIRGSQGGDKTGPQEVQQEVVGVESRERHAKFR